MYTFNDDFLNSDPAAVSKVLSLFQTEAGYLTRVVDLHDGRFVKTSRRRGHILKTEALAMEFVRLVMPL